MPFSIRIVRSQVDSRHGFGSPTNLSHRNATFFYEKRAELAFNKREKHSLHRVKLTKGGRVSKNITKNMNKPSYSVC